MNGYLQPQGWLFITEVRLAELCTFYSPSYCQNSWPFTAPPLAIVVDTIAVSEEMKLNSPSHVKQKPCKYVIR